MMQMYGKMMAEQRKMYLKPLTYKRIQVIASPAQVFVQVSTKKGIDFVSIPLIPMAFGGLFYPHVPVGFCFGIDAIVV